MSPLIVPDITRTKLRFIQRKSMSPTLGFISVQQYRGNSIYDPDLTGQGTSVVGLSQWSLFYNKYLVRASKIKFQVIELASGEDTNDETVECALIPTARSTIASIDPQRIGENTYGRFKVMFPQTNGAPNTTWMSSYMSTAKIRATSKEQVTSDSAFHSLVNANPSAEWYWNIFLQPADESSSHTYIVYVTITYYVEFFERKELSTTLLQQWALHQADPALLDTFDPIPEVADEVPCTHEDCLCQLDELSLDDNNPFLDYGTGVSN